jgi:hypothetical protein
MGLADEGEHSSVGWGVVLAFGCRYMEFMGCGSGWGNKKRTEGDSGLGSLAISVFEREVCEVDRDLVGFA